MSFGLLLFELDGPVPGLVGIGLVQIVFLKLESLACASVRTTALVLDDPFLYPGSSCPLDVLPI